MFPVRFCIISIGISPPGLVHFCNLVGGFRKSRNCSPPWDWLLVSPGRGFNYFGRRYSSGDGPVVSPSRGLLSIRYAFSSVISCFLSRARGLYCVFSPGICSFESPGWGSVILAGSIVFSGRWTAGISWSSVVSVGVFTPGCGNFLPPK